MAQLKFAILHMKNEPQMILIKLIFTDFFSIKTDF